METKLNGQERLEWLDVLKCLAMFLVLLGHCIVVDGTEYLRHYIYSFHMPIFFIISGMGYYLQTRKREYTFKEMLSNKCRTLLWPYFTLSFLCVIPWILNFRILSESALSYKELIAGIFYGHSNFLVGPTNSMWFVLTLFLAVMCVFILQFIMKNNEQCIIAATIGIAAIGYATSLYKDDFYPPWHFDTVPMAILFVVMGYFAMKYFNYIKQFLGGYGRQAVLLIAFTVIGFCCARFNAKISMFSNSYGDFLLFIGSVLGFGMACLILAMWCPKLKVLAFIGRNTLVYLAFHMPIFTFMTKCPGIDVYFTEHPYIKAVVTFILLIPISWVFEKYLYVLLGKKRKNKEKKSA